MRPDRIVVVISDQQRWDSLRCNGNAFTETAHASRMAQAGCNFGNATTPFPVCTPARASMWTGLRPVKHGVTYNRYGVDDVLDRESLISRTIFEDFRDNGWTTGYFGKWHLGENGADRFDHWDGFNSRGGHWENGKQAFQGGRWHPDLQTDALLDWLNEQDSDAAPVLAVISFYPPHQPFTAPTRYYEKFRNRGVPFAGYYAAVEGIDACLGRILDAVDDTTLVVFLSDHGETFDLHPERPHKFSCLDPSIRVPFMMQGPGVPAGLRIDEPVSLLDLPPTLLAAAGIVVPDYMAGRDIFDLIGGARDWRDHAYVENETLVSRTMERCLRTDRWKLILNAAEDHALYDLQNDPEEVLNLWNAPRRDIHNQYRHFNVAQTQQDMTARLADAAHEAEDPFGRAIAAQVARQLDANQPGFTRSRLPPDTPGAR